MDDEIGCGGTPYGDNWATWEEEFFRPARSLLLAAPWVILRGNHESCERAGVGWIYFFSLPSQATSNVCTEDLPPYYVSLGHQNGDELRLAVFDTANADGGFGKAERMQKYAKWVASLEESKGVVWLAMHQPLWFFGKRENEDDKEGKDPVRICDFPDFGNPPKASDVVNTLDIIQLGLCRARTNQRVRMILSGDTHLFQFVRVPEAEMPTQIVVGNSGTRLDPDPCNPTIVSSCSEQLAKWTGAVRATFGFVVLYRNDDSWAGELQDTAGNQVIRFDTTNLRLER